MTYSYIYFFTQNPCANIKLPKVKYNKLTAPGPVTRQGKNDPCQCSVCCLSRATLCQDTNHLLDRYVEVDTVPTRVKLL